MIRATMALLQVVHILFILSFFLTEAFPMESQKGHWHAAVMKEVFELQRIAVASLVLIILIILLSITIIWLKRKIKKKISDRLPTSSKDAQTMTENEDEEHKLKEVLVINTEKTDNKREVVKRSENKDEETETRRKEEKNTGNEKADNEKEEQVPTVVGNLEENKTEENELVDRTHKKKKRLKKCFCFLAPLIKKIEDQKRKK